MWIIPGPFSSGNISDHKCTTWNSWVKTKDFNYKLLTCICHMFLFCISSHWQTSYYNPSSTSCFWLYGTSSRFPLWFRVNMPLKWGDMHICCCIKQYLTVHWPMNLCGCNSWSCTCGNICSCLDKLWTWNPPTTRVDRYLPEKGVMFNADLPQPLCSSVVGKLKTDCTFKLFILEQRERERTRRHAEKCVNTGGMGLLCCH